MGLKSCEKCGEQADEAKAFCPECGNPFVTEEKREEVSDFDKYAGTVNVSKTMYQLMLSEMDLDISRPKESTPPKQTEPIRPTTAVTNPIPPPPVPANPVSPENKPPVPVIRTGKNPLIILAVTGGVFLMFLATATLVLVYLYFS